MHKYPINILIRKQQRQRKGHDDANDELQR